MSKCIGAHTNSGALYPGYINFSRDDDGSISIIIRSDPKITKDSSYICGFERDKGKPGRCTPGDSCCNNYCNMAPEKGKMQHSPTPCTQISEGASAHLKLSAADFEQFMTDVNAAS